MIFVSHLGSITQVGGRRLKALLFHVGLGRPLVLSGVFNVTNKINPRRRVDQYSCRVLKPLLGI